jgi:MoaA/NifB/PqqE/SkfB family radical SAM enzyme
MKNNKPDKNQIGLYHLLRLPVYFIRGIKFQAAGKIYTPKPLTSIVNVTHRCNSRCVMCSYWKKQDQESNLTLSEIVKIYQSPLFSSLERLSLSGGEATLRDDLREITEGVLEVCPSICQINLSTNGLDTDRVTQQIQGLLDLTSFKRKRLAIMVSLDGIGPIHESIRRVPRAFERVQKTLQQLKILQRKTPFYLSTNCVVQPGNSDHLVETAEYSQGLGIPLTFSPVCTSNLFMDTQSDKDSLVFSDTQIHGLKNIFNKYMASYLNPSNVPFWQEYFKILAGKKRKLPCFMLYHQVFLESNGDLRICSCDNSLIYGNIRQDNIENIWYSKKTRNLRQKIKRELCPSCTVNCDTAFTFTHEFFYFAGYYFNEKRRKIFRQESGW